MKISKAQSRKRIKQRIRKSLKGTASKPRLAVYRSNKSIYAQLIDDVSAMTVASASSKENSIGSAGSKSEQAKAVGSLIAEKAKAKKIDAVVFDRGGYLYHGRVKALAEGAREGGLNF
jgi:large subunit ribosomal protein L18